MTNKTPGQIILDAVANKQYNAASEIMSAELFSNLNECMCQRKEKVASDFGRDISEGDSAYDAFFKKAMKKFGISSPGELKGEEEKKKFFNYIDKNFKASNEELGEESIPPEDTPFGKAGNAVGHMLAVLGDRLDGVSPTDVRRRRKGKVRPAPGLGALRPTFGFDVPPEVPTGEEELDPFLANDPYGGEILPGSIVPPEQYMFGRRDVGRKRPAPGTQGEFDLSKLKQYGEEEYEDEMDMMSVMPDDEEDGKPDQAYPPRRIKDQGGPGQMQGQMPMGAAPGKMMGGMQAPMQGMGGMQAPMQGMGQGMGGMKPPMQGMGQGMQMNPQMMAKLMQMMKKRKGAM